MWLVRITRKMWLVKIRLWMWLVSVTLSLFGIGWQLTFLDHFSKVTCYGQQSRVMSWFLYRQLFTVRCKERKNKYAPIWCGTNWVKCLFHRNNNRVPMLLVSRDCAREKCSYTTKMNVEQKNCRGVGKFMFSVLHYVEENHNYYLMQFWPKKMLQPYSTGTCMWKLT